MNCRVTLFDIIVKIFKNLLIIKTYHEVRVLLVTQALLCRCLRMKTRLDQHYTNILKFTCNMYRQFKSCSNITHLFRCNITIAMKMKHQLIFPK